MEDLVMRFVENLIDRVSGPMKLRLVIQPLIAIALAIIAGRKDAREGRTPYFLGVVTDQVHRRQMMLDGWKGIGKVFLVALLLDSIYQLIVLKFVYPGEAVLVAIVLAIVPYLLVRSLVARLMYLGRKPAGRP